MLPSQFVVRTDHYSLKYLLDQQLTIIFQQRWLVKSMEFDFAIKYKQGRTMLWLMLYHK